MSRSKVSFFKLNASSKELIAMGAGSEAGFFALATAIVDHIASSPSSLLLCELFQQYQENFPIPKLREKLINAKTFFAYFLHTPGLMNQFIPEVAHLLKQSAAQTLQIKITDLLFNDASLQALSARLGLAIILRISADKKELPLKWSYQVPGVAAKALIIQMEGDVYQLLVNKPELFRSVTPGKYQPQAKQHAESKGDVLPNRSTQIQASYEKTFTCLSTMMKLGETSKEALLNCYIRHLPTDLAGFRQYNENYFKKLNVNSFTSFNDEVISSLIEVLSRYIAVNLISEDVLEELGLNEGKRLKVG